MSYNHVFFVQKGGEVAKLKNGPVSPNKSPNNNKWNGGLVSEANNITAKIGVDLLVSERRRNKAPSLSL